MSAVTVNCRASSRPVLPDPLTDLEDLTDREDIVRCLLGQFCNNSLCLVKVAPEQTSPPPQLVDQLDRLSAAAYSFNPLSQRLTASTLTKDQALVKLLLL